MNGAELIAAERKRQIEKEGWTPAHDDQHRKCELADAAICYIQFAGIAGLQGSAPRLWPWAAGQFKPTGDPIRDLTKAGALIAAEIDRLQRLKP